ncbi:unnamed protein product [Penicillium salamii]|uniref:Uncharacterized protein n=1 Tax=Penicillium salamii TaxID=1612424 RepID=A0A9W4K627_9EURO|nr:unnamed protein product [Penicillium salamii]CAG8044290.1 unnamed protein product [Penicillium salamii]CAG8107461.1 unnamed protein product [Penicillium salamii]CAG8140631.1 unnamed protein product [Penicillium salamii]CAG8176864.1 unnamed protein product [Penicillium salamii]
MGLLNTVALFSFLTSAVVAFPQQTAAAVTTAPASTITKAASLSCSDGSTAVYTVDCTLGFPTSYCSKPEPPISCSSGFFPSVYHPGHCIEASTCFPVTADWITTECSNGAVPYTTKTMYEGTLAGGESTIISGEFFIFFLLGLRSLVAQTIPLGTKLTDYIAVSCSCSQDSYYSYTLLPGASKVDTFCMPSSSCAAGMTTSTETNAYCATAPATACQNVPLVTSACKCENPTETAVYPDLVGARPTGCSA